jgi:diguanylate cyclase (GGDEF)-like protein
MRNLNTRPKNATAYTLHSKGPRRPSQRSACVLVIQGDELGRRVNIGRAPLLIGRSNEADLVLADKSVSRAHCRVWAEQGAYHIRDLGATNPTRVNGAPLDGRRKLVDGDQITVGESILKFIGQNSVEAGYHEAIHQLATRDALTDLCNRRHFNELADKQIRQAKRDAWPLSLCLLDVDLFKSINDRYGHGAGDDVLRQIAALLRQQAHDDDIAARIGGEEFALQLPRRTADEAALIANQLREAVAAAPFVLDGQTQNITISIGVAALGHKRRSRAALMAAADAALYRAKSAGRNLVCVEE